MPLTTWFRRWNSPEAWQERKKARQENWAEANREADQMRIAAGPAHTPRARVPDDNDAGPPQD